MSHKVMDYSFARFSGAQVHDHGALAVCRYLTVVNAETRGKLLTRAEAEGLSAAGIHSALDGVQIRDLEVKLRGLPPELAGFRLVQISDVHVGPLLRRDWVAHQEASRQLPRFPAAECRRRSAGRCPFRRCARPVRRPHRAARRPARGTW